jgi:CHAT domain-containing protein
MKLHCVRSLCFAVILLTVQPCLPSDLSATDLLKRALYFANLYNWRAATPLFQQAEVLLRNAGDQRNALYAHLGSRRRDFSSSIGARSQEVAELLNTDPFLKDHTELRLFALTIKGDLDGEIDQSSARQDWTEVMRLAKELNETMWSYRAEGQLGFADYYDGDLASCQRKVASALIAATKAGDIGAQIFFLSATAQGYLKQRLLPQTAIDYAKKAVAIAAANPDAGSPAVANSTLAVALAESGDTKEALELVGKLLATPNLKLPERFDYPLAAGRIALLDKRYADGVRYFEQAVAEGESAGATRETADAQSELSEIFLSKGNVSTAEALARNALNTLERAGVLSSLPVRLDALAQVLIAEKKYAEADAIYDHAASIQDALIGKADSMIVKTALITGADQLYSHHFALIADHFNNPEEAYNVLEQGRSRGIVDLLLSGGSTSPQAVSIEQTISKLRLKLATMQNGEGVPRVREAIFLAEQQRAVNPDLTILSTHRFKPIQLKTIQQCLRPSEVVLEYVVAEPSSYALAITRTSKQIIELPGRKTIENLVEDYRKAVHTGTSAAKEAHALYEALLHPISEAAKARYVIVPDGPLNLLPFDALVDQSGRYVVESHIVTYAPSSTTLYLLRSKPFAAKRANALLAVGGVPYSEGGIRLTSAERGLTRDRTFGNLPNSADEIKAAEAAITNPKNIELTGPRAMRLASEFGPLWQFILAHPKSLILLVRGF